MFKKTLSILLVTVIFIFAGFYLFLQRQAPDISPEYPITKLEQKIIYINSHQLSVKIADEPHEQSRGLSGRESLGENEGMLFIFPQPDKYSFWMKDMKFPLDIIWINENKVITDLTKNLPPDTFPATFSPSSSVKYVLEINAGWSDKNNISIGDVVNY